MINVSFKNWRDFCVRGWLKYFDALSVSNSISTFCRQKLPRCFGFGGFWLLALGAPIVAAQTAPDVIGADGRQIFVQVCATCHVTGVAGAPRLGVSTDWSGRVGKGHRGLLGAVLRGKDGMPPKGGNASISDRDAAAALDFMLRQIAAPWPTNGGR